MSEVVADSVVEDEADAGGANETRNVRKVEFLTAVGRTGPIAVGPDGIIPGWDPAKHREPRQEDFRGEVDYCRFKARRARLQEADWRERAERFEARAESLESYGAEGAAAIREVEEAQRALEQAAQRARSRGVPVTVSVQVHDPDPR